MDGIIVKPIEYGSAEYENELELRNRILRIPIGLNLFAEDLRIDEPDVHIGAFLHGILAGVLVLKRTSSISIKMRQVAVDDKLQARGIGTLLVQYAEDLAKTEGYKEMQLHARKTAAGFYSKLGYRAASGEFMEVGIPHVEMRKELD